MLKVLINAYACSPEMGSEPGMAWNWCVHLAKHCELYIITEGEFRERIEKVVPTLPQGSNMHFYYNPVSDEVRMMCWNQGNWLFYKYYRDWQWGTYQMAKKICSKEKIDILHQLNMIGFREPGYLWKLSKETGIKFVWGPVDAKDKFPLAYAQGAGLRSIAFLWLKNAITCWQLKHSNRVRKAANVASVVISASSNSVKSFKQYMNIDSILLNETGCSSAEVTIHKRMDKKTYDILWVGKMDFRKQLRLALEAVTMANSNDIRLHIVGGGEAAPYKLQAKSLGIMDICVWHGVVSHDKVQKLMQMADVLLFTSVAEGTPHVVLEAIANHLPVLCFDTCGQGDAVNQKVGIKIKLSSPESSVKDFATQLDYLNHREVLKKMSENCRQRQIELSWEKKAEEMVSLYNKIVQGNYSAISLPDHK